MAKVYQGITFPEDYNKSYEEFKEDFASNWVFLKIPHLKREAEFKKAYKIATAKNGNTSRTTEESKENNSGSPE